MHCLKVVLPFISALGNEICAETENQKTNMRGMYVNIKTQITDKVVVFTGDGELNELILLNKEIVFKRKCKSKK